ncbi:SusC/RagA family TonB-linked outer membrane protein [uncultured Polaribacter sp.]|uniref:SusC/RagA family TonB-linked outer membrane protein n=1 Tax=uncultured Polaribacter sp. TaxID=174711 RepID=UPI00260A9CA2|nr:SusC/RagA family TonB-linked outer membrane protein [uncultured Polaribacter sp.]
MKNLSTICIFDAITIKLDLKMKLTGILFLLTLFQMSANDTYSQNTKISLDLKSATIEKVLHEIERKTDINFFFKNADINLNKKINLNAKKTSVQKILETIFKNSNIKFEVFNKQIILREEIKQKKEALVKSLKKILKIQETVSGVITDVNGTPLFGATVVIKGTKRATSSDFDGRYSIDLPEAATTLVITYVGFKRQEVVINNRTTINIQLEEDETSLDEVVVIGYGKVKKEALTGAVGTVDVKSVQDQGTILNIDQALQGQVAGVQVSAPLGRPGAAAKVRIRGSSSILGTNQPLYVIDGVPIEPSIEMPGFRSFIDNISNINTTPFENEGTNNDLGFIDFNNIESISILKDASATAIYGSRGSNGVVMITTKKGNKASKPQFELLVTKGLKFIQRVDVLNSSQFQQIYKEAIENYQNSGGIVPSNDTFAQGILEGTEVDESVNIDWQNLVSKNITTSSNYSFNVRGASERGSYYSSLSLQKNNGAIDGDELTRYTFSLNLKQNLKDNLEFFTNLSLGKIENKFALSTPYGAPFIRPDKEPYDENGIPVRRIGDINNPISERESRSDAEDFSLLGSIGLEYEPIEDLFIKTTGILQYIDRENYSFYPSFTQFRGNARGALINSKTFNPSIETTLTYDFSSKSKHHFNFLLGNTYQNNNSETVNTFGENFPNDDTLTSINYASENLSNQLAITRSTLISFFSRLQYDYDNKYLLTLTARTDGSSKFGINKRWASFPSAGIGWNIHREEFAKDLEWLSFLKLRASFGQSGNVTFDPNQSFSLFGALNGNLGFYDENTGLVPLRIGNPDLKWEITTQKDFGMEFSFFKNSIKGEIGYYQKDTKDVLFQTELPLTTGIGTVIANLGDTQNRGYELSLDFNLIDKNDLKWNLRLNSSTAKTKIVSLNSTYKNESGNIDLSGVLLKEGEALGLIKGYIAEGIFQTQEEINALDANAPRGYYQAQNTQPGDIRYADLDGDGEVSASSISGPDVTNIGNIEPDFFGGINTNIAYKGLSLNVFANYSVGNDIYWEAGENTFSFTTFNDQSNKLTQVFDRWTPENTDAKYPRAVYRTNVGVNSNNARQSSLYIEKGDYLRIKTITLSYRLPKKTLKHINLQGLSFYVTGTNLFTITNYSGADPEFTNIASFRAPVDNNNYPTYKEFIAGMRITF